MDKTKNANIRIIGVEANRLMGIFEVKEEARFFLYNSALPVSLDILKLKEISGKLKGEDKKVFYTVSKKEKKPYNGIFFDEADDKKIYTDAIINVSFNSALRKETGETEEFYDLAKGDSKRKRRRVDLSLKKLRKSYTLMVYV